MTLKKIRALALLSGGLDSILAAKLIQNQEIKVTGLVFRSLFFSPSLPSKILDISLPHLEIVKHPHYGYGKNANPCLDCHLLMLKEAKKIMSAKGGKKNYDFLITGEVLGQRPFSQNKQALGLLEKQSGLEGLILRPLSAQLLPPTIPEQKGWVKRDQLLGIQGRSRKTQLQLAKKFKLKDYSAPGASCILTDPQYSQRLFKMLKANPQTDANDIKLLKLGRHFWKGKNLIVIGRNHEENLLLNKVTQKGDIILEPQSFPGPVILLRTYPKTLNLTLGKPLTKPLNPTLEKALRLLKKYSPKAPKKITLQDFSLDIRN